MQPVHVQSPPRRFSSMRAVLAPSNADMPAATSPAVPPPITATSYSCIGLISPTEQVPVVQPYGRAQRRDADQSQTDAAGETPPRTAPCEAGVTHEYQR